MANNFADELYDINKDDDQHVWYIDFSKPTWQNCLKSILKRENKKARTKAVQGRTVNRRVLVHPKWFEGKSWDDLITVGYRAQALLIAAYGEISDQPCQKAQPMPSKKPATTDPKIGLPFGEHIHIKGHFSFSCANCASQSYYKSCTLNRTVTVRPLHDETEVADICTI